MSILALNVEVKDGKKQMKFKIVSDGTPKGTKVINTETGETVENVTRIFWEVCLDSLATAHIEIRKCEVEIEVEKDLAKIIEEKTK